MHMETINQGNGNPDVFDSEWRDALASNDPRWLSYPADNPFNQTQLFERVKADQIDDLLRHLNISSGRVLEYACGSAGMAAYFATRGFDVIATDLSVNALRLAQRNATVRNVESGRFVTSGGDVFELPFADNTFDVVMSYGLLEHFTEESLTDLLAETYRVLRPGGVHVVDVIHGRWSIRTFATALNFAASACVHVGKGQAARIPALREAYFRHYYENTLRADDYARLFKTSGLERVEAHTCRPFPLLALSGKPERAYVSALKTSLSVWRWFDRTDLPGLNGLGWMYLVHGVKPLA